MVGIVANEILVTVNVIQRQPVCTINDKNKDDIFCVQLKIYNNTRTEKTCRTCVTYVTNTIYLVLYIVSNR